ncbi:hypothetical protein [Glutamicibacter sp. NPDC087344]|uniref:hypothetical protein n=1 Tax=Glutamicibacter sp. NPDC087344 TaxID=3363994 RepID=UPI0037FDE74F
MNLAELLQELDRYSTDLGHAGTAVANALSELEKSRGYLAIFNSKDSVDVTVALGRAKSELNDVVRSLIPSMTRTLHNLDASLRE